MKEPFPYDMRAVLGAAGKGFSLKKITAGTVFLLLGYVLYVAFTYLALMIDGVRFDYIWQSYGLFPVKIYSFDSVIAIITQGIGIVLAVLAISQSILAGAVISFEEIRGDYFYSIFDSVKFTFKRTPTLVLGFLSLGAFIGFVWLLGFLTGLISRIPEIGEIAIGLFYLVPIFITFVLTLFIIFVGLAGIVLLPVVIAAQKENELFGPLLHLFSVLIKEPLRFFWYLAVTSVIAKVASFVLAYVFYRSIQFSHMVLKSGGGDTIDRMFNAAFNMLPLNSPILGFFCNIFPGITFGFSFSRFGYGGDKSIGAILLAISFFILFVVIGGYMVSVISTGMARGYTVIRRMKDDYLITEEDPMKSHEDYVNPPFKTDKS
ncbi:MAG: hypothetical protein KAR42_11670 [candidate division Zixibacteria bacterium]|nr:hypothetical protein [candidate division Zixibacteria bacterium]